MNDDRSRARFDDPARVRALAHPTRMRMLALLRTNGPQTAAMLGTAIDEAPGTISYHASRLAAVGLIEPAPPEREDRRERWWRAAHLGSQWDLADALDDPERYLAMAALDRTAADFSSRTHERYVDRAPGFGREWVAAAGGRDQVLRLTPPELTAMLAELDAVVLRWEAQAARHEPGDGSEQVYVLTQGYRWPY